MVSEYLAFDLGASSGRGIIGAIEKGKISLQEIHRFENTQAQIMGHYHWDIIRLFTEMKYALSLAFKNGHRQISSLGVDTWGVDFGLVGRNNVLLGNPYCYRDARTDGMMDKVFNIVPAADIYRITGIQFMQFNTIFQLFSMVEENNPLLDIAEKLLFMPDLLNFLFTGEKVSEYSIASTSQLLNAVSKQWEPELFARLALPIDVMAEIVPPGTCVGKIMPEIMAETGAPEIDVIAPGCHDTASAIAAVPAQGKGWAYLSSGTWSLMGIEAEKPVITPASRENNFTNEGGVNGTIRFLKNIMGLWLLQSCRKNWANQGSAGDYDELLAAAAQAAPFRSIVDPDAPVFLNPPDMPEAITGYCNNTGQPAPTGKGEFVRAILESLALKYRYVIEKINSMIDEPVTTLHIVGGGSQNELLNQFAANATGLPVVAGPVEATALGNIMVQAIARGELASVNQGREIIRNSFQLKHYEPQDRNAWNDAYAKHRHLFS
ncbi:MAG TPA: rhamnulokinase family protein [bacterium]|mgnify:CR=1 FL=1|nr:rhamnulokinase family protein [bacterium]HPN45375.1 rhamnulokinase family protein [bacterium]